MKILARKIGILPTEEELNLRNEKRETLQSTKYIRYIYYLCKNCNECILPNRSSRNERAICQTCDSEMIQVRANIPSDYLKQTLQEEGLYSEEVEAYIRKYPKSNRE